MEHARLATGGRLGRYEILEHVASGGMAEVYLCRRSGIGGFQRQVILKVVRASFAEEAEYARMFLDEARIAGAVNHPNIAAVYEAEESDGVAFLVMEYVAGPTMSRLVKVSEQLERPNRLAMAWLIAGAARGLHHVHNATAGTGRGAGLIHRDVSLDNILASREGNAKVVDFGIAMATDRLSRTEGDVVKGKLAYVSPEQLANDVVDYRADLYALGVCLYRSTVYVPPFADVNPHALLKARLTNTFRRPTEIEPSFPEELERIILKALAVDPTERHASAGQLANEIEAWIRSAQPTFDPAEVAAWIASCFPSEADWRSPPISRSAPSSLSTEPSRGETTAIRGVFEGAATAAVSRAKPNDPTPWAVTAASAVLVGLGILALINAGVQASQAVEPLDDAGVASVIAPPTATAPAIAAEPAPDEPAPQPPSEVPPVAPRGQAPAAPTAVARAPLKSLTRDDALAFVAAALRKQGWTIREHDRKGANTVDLVATRGASVRLVDVKLVEAETADRDVPQNRRRMRLASEAWIAQNPDHPQAQLEVAAVTLQADGPTVRWISVAP